LLVLEKSVITFVFLLDLNSTAPFSMAVAALSSGFGVGHPAWADVMKIHAAKRRRLLSCFLFMCFNLKVGY
jgi:hypothetical protein